MIRNGYKLENYFLLFLHQIFVNLTINWIIDREYPIKADLNSFNLQLLIRFIPFNKVCPILLTIMFINLNFN